MSPIMNTITDIFVLCDLFLFTIAAAEYMNHRFDEKEG